MHIGDVVAAQILAMEEPKASGRILCSSSVAYHWSEIIEILRTKYPLYPFETRYYFLCFTLKSIYSIDFETLRHVLMFQVR